MTIEPLRRIGLLAGAGRFPIAFAEAARRQGVPVVGVGLLGVASDSLRELCDYYTTASLGRIGKSIAVFKRFGVNRVVMAGKVDKTLLFQKFRWIRHLPDWRTIHLFLRYARENRKDDTLLLAVIREYARDDIHFEPAVNFCPELLVKHGFLTRRKPTPAQWRDIRFGWDIAK
ncbi:MAG TPA: LpxI family protein, partial [Planctomycetaceae bacterium]|nr:LpxI family protein [Planctomycetaceae bacterium]